MWPSHLQQHHHRPPFPPGTLQKATSQVNMSHNVVSFVSMDTTIKTRPRIVISKNHHLLTTIHSLLGVATQVLLRHDVLSIASSSTMSATSVSLLTTSLILNLFRSLLHPIHLQPPRLYCITCPNHHSLIFLSSSVIHNTSSPFSYICQQIQYLFPLNTKVQYVWLTLLSV